MKMIELHRVRRIRERDGGAGAAARKESSSSSWISDSERTDT